ncbi:MAG TPA: potassium-transporting ATPase subunit KdpC [Steroidobacteraceae bacterium]|jgi:K+-transporting ATPase ATPase C chain|nr:potassium-transporting ATPase subunit KdpC [Steroidobacteraceae bacterium]
MSKLLLQSSLCLLVLTLMTGVVYPFAVTGVAALCCAHHAGGSLIRVGDKVVGSALLAQPFDQPQYFWPRPSGISPIPYDGRSSSGSNLGPTNDAQLEAVQQRFERLRAADPDNQLPIPIDLVTASGSGLDPDISPAAAEYQLARVARARGLPPERVRNQIAAATRLRQWGIFGEPRVNVLELNLALDADR